LLPGPIGSEHPQLNPSSRQSLHRRHWQVRLTPSLGFSGTLRSHHHRPRRCTAPVWTPSGRASTVRPHRYPPASATPNLCTTC